MTEQFKTIYTPKTKYSGPRMESTLTIGYATKEAADGSHTLARRELTISTTRHSQSPVLVTIARVSLAGGGWTTHAVFQDFNQRVAVVPCARVTEKAIKEAHDAAMALAGEIVAAACAQYSDDAQTPEDALARVA